MRWPASSELRKQGLHARRVPGARRRARRRAQRHDGAREVRAAWRWPTPTAASPRAGRWCRASCSPACCGTTCWSAGARCKARRRGAVPGAAAGGGCGLRRAHRRHLRPRQAGRRHARDLADAAALRAAHAEHRRRRWSSSRASAPATTSCACAPTAARCRAELADWWEDFHLGDDDEREALLQDLRATHAAQACGACRRPKRRRRGRRPRGGAPAAATPSEARCAGRASAAAVGASRPARRAAAAPSAATARAAAGGMTGRARLRRPGRQPRRSAGDAGTRRCRRWPSCRGHALRGGLAAVPQRPDRRPGPRFHQRGGRVAHHADATRAAATRCRPSSRRIGRERPYRNAPRTLDLDLLLYGERVARRPGPRSCRTRACTSVPSCCCRWPTWRRTSCTPRLGRLDARSATVSPINRSRP